MWIEWIMVLLLGLSFGSFGSLLIHRLPTGERIGMTRSHCPKCGTTLKPRDLIPLLSWCLSRGRCRYCQTPIHWRYPAMELVSAAIALGIYALYGWHSDSLLIGLLSFMILILCVIDFEHRIIPDSLQIAIGSTGVLYGLTHGMHIAEMAAGLLIGSLIGLALKYGFRLVKGIEGLGMGDVKFMAAAGIWLGTEPLAAFFFYAGILGIISALLWRLIHEDPRFPFGPALALSMLLLVIYPPSAGWFVAVSIQLVTILQII